MQWNFKLDLLFHLNSFALGWIACWITSKHLWPTIWEKIKTAGGWVVSQYRAWAIKG